jgi:hypothetical protein
MKVSSLLDTEFELFVGGFMTVGNWINVCSGYLLFLPSSFLSTARCILPCLGEKFSTEIPGERQPEIKSQHASFLLPQQ